MSDDFEDMMNNFLRQFQEQFAPRNSTTDPTKYPRYVEITDDRALLMDAQVDSMIAELNKLRRLVNQKSHELAALKEKMFLFLEELYPQIKEGHETAIKNAGNKRFYVGWD